MELKSTFEHSAFLGCSQTALMLHLSPLEIVAKALELA